MHISTISLVILVYPKFSSSLSSPCCPRKIPYQKKQRAKQRVLGSTIKTYLRYILQCGVGLITKIYHQPLYLM